MAQQGNGCNKEGGLHHIADNPPTDLRLPEQVRKTMNEWGFAKDEFKDNGNWPKAI